MQYKPSKWVSGYKHGPAASYTQITRMGLFLNVATSKFEPLDSTWDNLHSGGMFISDDNKIYFRDETNKDIYINSPADNQLEIYASGGITAPLQPAFTACANSDQAALVPSTNTTVVFDRELFDQGDDYNNSTNIFTAPVTGKYWFTANVIFVNIDTVPVYYITYVKASNTGSTLFSLFDPRQFAGDVANGWSVVLSGALDMDAGDTAYVYVYQAAGTEQTTLDGSGSYLKTFFSGFLAC